MSDDHKNVAWKDSLGGILAAAAKITIGHPFDTLKVRLQSIKSGATATATPAAAAPPPPPASASASGGGVSLRAMMTQTWKYEGIRGFYKGVTPNIPGIAIYNIVNFGAYGQAVNLITHWNKRDQSTTATATGNGHRPLTMTECVIAGGMSGGAASFVVAPLELIRCRLQVQYGSNPLGNAAAPQAVTYRGPIDLMRQTLLHTALPRQSQSPLTPNSADLHTPNPPQSVAATQARMTLVSQTHLSLRHTVFGMRGLFHGYWLTVLREVPSNMAYFGTFEGILRMFGYGTDNVPSPGHKHTAASPLLVGMAGGCAGVANWLVIFPVDTIKSRMQTDDLYNPKYRSALHCYRVTVASDGGHRALWRGLTPCLMRAFLANALAFNVLNLSKQLLYSV